MDIDEGILHETEGIRLVVNKAVIPSKNLRRRGFAQTWCSGEPQDFTLNEILEKGHKSWSFTTFLFWLNLVRSRRRLNGVKVILDGFKLILGDLLNGVFHDAFDVNFLAVFGDNSKIHKTKKLSPVKCNFEVEVQFSRRFLDFLRGWAKIAILEFWVEFKAIMGISDVKVISGNFPMFKHVVIDFVIPVKKFTIRHVALILLYLLNCVSCVDRCVL